MNNKPVAYAMFRNGEYYDAIHPDEQAKTVGEYDIPLYTHPVKELHLSLQKSKQTGELLAVTYTDDEHRIVEVLWQKPPALTDEEIALVWDKFSALPSPKDIKGFAKAILRKAQEK
jgi:hypothetical protein